MDFRQKYLKYKNKYLTLKNQKGGINYYDTRDIIKNIKLIIKYIEREKSSHYDKNKSIHRFIIELSNGVMCDESRTTSILITYLTKVISSLPTECFIEIGRAHV